MSKQVTVDRELLGRIESAFNSGMCIPHDSAVRAGIRAALAAQPEQAIGWYCVSRDGMATLCADQDDAQRTADSGDRDWPNSAPHRAVMLFEHPPAQPSGEPAAITSESGKVGCVNHDCEQCQKAQEPLAESQIIDIARVDCKITFSDDDIEADNQIDSVIALGRMIERAHGIGTPSEVL